MEKVASESLCGGKYKEERSERVPYFYAWIYTSFRLIPGPLMGGAEPKKLNKGFRNQTLKLPTCSDVCSAFSGCVFFLLLGREGNGNPLQHSGLRIPWTVYPWGHKESDATEQLFTSLADATTLLLLCQPTPAWDLLPTFWEAQPGPWPNPGLTGLILPSGRPENKQKTPAPSTLRRVFDIPSSVPNKFQGNQSQHTKVLFHQNWSMSKVWVTSSSFTGSGELGAQNPASSPVSEGGDTASSSSGLGGSLGSVRAIASPRLTVYHSSGHQGRKPLGLQCSEITARLQLLTQPWNGHCRKKKSLY